MSVSETTRVQSIGYSMNGLPLRVGGTLPLAEF